MLKFRFANFNFFLSYSFHFIQIKLSYGPVESICYKLAFSALYFAKKVYNHLQSHKFFSFLLEHPSVSDMQKYPAQK